MRAFVPANNSEEYAIKLTLLNISGIICWSVRREDKQDVLNTPIPTNLNRDLESQGA